MKFIAKFLALGVFAAATTLAAHATPINGTVAFNAIGTYNSTGVNLTSGAVISGLSSGNFSFLNSSAVLTGIDPIVYASLTPGLTLFTASEGGETLTFTTGSLVVGTPDPTFGGLLFTETGTFSLSGTTTGGPTAGTVTVSSSGPAGTITVGFTSYAQTLAPTPEPSSLVLLGTGLASAAGVVFRKRRSVV